MFQANKTISSTASSFALRAIFGVWINFCVAIIAICVRTIFRYRIKRTLSGRRRVSLWWVSPAVTPFVFASMFCVVVASVGAASTVISNYSVVTNSVIHDVVVQGQNVISTIRLEVQYLMCPAELRSRERTTRRATWFRAEQQFSLDL